MPDKHLFASYTYTPIILITMWLSYSVIKATGGQNGDGGSVTSNLKPLYYDVFKIQELHNSYGITTPMQMQRVN